MSIIAGGGTDGIATPTDGERLWLPQTDHELLRKDFLELPKSALPELGPSTQALAAVMKVCDVIGAQATFASLATIAGAALMPVRTVKWQISKCIELGWLENRGREVASRRTSTHALSKRAIENRGPYLRLPRWVCGRLDTWSERVVYAVIASLEVLVAVLEEQEKDGTERLFLTDGALAKLTGLSQKASTQAKHLLCERLYIQVDSCIGRPDFICLEPKIGCYLDELPPPVMSGKQMSLQFKREKVARIPQSDVVKVARMPGVTSEALQKKLPSGVVEVALEVEKVALGAEKVARVGSKSCPRIEPQLLSSTADLQLTYLHGQSSNGKAAAAGGTDHEDSFFKAWEEAKLESIGRRAVKAANADQQDTLNRVVWLGARGKLAEHFIDSAAEATRAKRDAGTLRKPVPYFISVLRDEKSKAGDDIDELLKTVPLQGVSK
jgi:hypothetical protein